MDEPNLDFLSTITLSELTAYNSSNFQEKIDYGKPENEEKKEDFIVENQVQEFIHKPATEKNNSLSQLEHLTNENAKLKEQCVSICEAAENIRVLYQAEHKELKKLKIINSDLAKNLETFENQCEEMKNVLTSKTLNFEQNIAKCEEKCDKLYSLLKTTIQFTYNISEFLIDNKVFSSTELKEIKSIKNILKDFNKRELKDMEAKLGQAEKLISKFDIKKFKTSVLNMLMGAVSNNSIESVDAQTQCSPNDFIGINVNAETITKCDIGVNFPEINSNKLISTQASPFKRATSFSAKFGNEGAALGKAKNIQNEKELSSLEDNFNENIHFDLPINSKTNISPVFSDKGNIDPQYDVNNVSRASVTESNKLKNIETNSKYNCNNSKQHNIKILEFENDKTKENTNDHEHPIWSFWKLFGYAIFNVVKEENQCLIDIFNQQLEQYPTLVKECKNINELVNKHKLFPKDYQKRKINLLKDPFEIKPETFSENSQSSNDLFKKSEIKEGEKSNVIKESLKQDQSVQYVYETVKKINENYTNSGSKASTSNKKQSETFNFTLSNGCDSPLKELFNNLSDSSEDEDNFQTTCEKTENNYSNESSKIPTSIFEPLESNSKFQKLPEYLQNQNFEKISSIPSTNNSSSNYSNSTKRNASTLSTNNLFSQNKKSISLENAKSKNEKIDQSSSLSLPILLTGDEIIDCKTLFSNKKQVKISDTINKTNQNKPKMFKGKEFHLNNLTNTCSNPIELVQLNNTKNGNDTIANERDKLIQTNINNSTLEKSSLKINENFSNQNKFNMYQNSTSSPEKDSTSSSEKDSTSSPEKDSTSSPEKDSTSSPENTNLFFEKIRKLNSCSQFMDERSYNEKSSRSNTITSEGRYIEINKFDTIKTSLDSDIIQPLNLSLSSSDLHNSDTDTNFSTNCDSSSDSDFSVFGKNEVNTSTFNVPTDMNIENSESIKVLLNDLFGDAPNDMSNQINLTSLKTSSNLLPPEDKICSVSNNNILSDLHNDLLLSSSSESSEDESFSKRKFIKKANLPSKLNKTNFEAIAPIQKTAFDTNKINLSKKEELKLDKNVVFEPENQSITQRQSNCFKNVNLKVDISNKKVENFEPPSSHHLSSPFNYEMQKNEINSELRGIVAKEEELKKCGIYCKQLTGEVFEIEKNHDSNHSNTICSQYPSEEKKINKNEESKVIQNAVDEVLKIFPKPKIVGCTKIREKLDKMKKGLHSKFNVNNIANKCNTSGKVQTVQLKESSANLINSDPKLKFSNEITVEPKENIGCKRKISSFEPDYRSKVRKKATNDAKKRSASQLNFNHTETTIKSSSKSSKKFKLDNIATKDLSSFSCFYNSISPEPELQNKETSINKHFEKSKNVCEQLMSYSQINEAFNDKSNFAIGNVANDSLASLENNWNELSITNNFDNISNANLSIPYSITNVAEMCSPLSPKYIKEPHMSVVDPEPVIIPTERENSNMNNNEITLVSIFLDNFNSEEQAKFSEKRNTKEEVKDPLLTKLNSVIANYIYTSNDQYPLKKCMKHIEAKTNDNMNVIYEAIVEIAEKLKFTENLEESEKWTIAGDRIILLVDGFSKHYPQFKKKLIRSIHHKLFKMKIDHKTFQVEKVVNLIKFNLYLMNMQIANEDDRRLSRTLILKCLYYYNYKALPMVFEILKSYPTVLPMNKWSINYPDPIVRTIQCILNCSTYDNIKTEMYHSKICNLLKQSYKYERFKPGKEETVSLLLSKVRNNIVHNISYCLAVICKYFGNEWTQNYVINKSILPLLNEYYGKITDTDENDQRIHCLLESLSFLIKPFPLDFDNIERYLKIFTSFLHITTRKTVQQAAICGLIRISRFGYVNVFTSIANWKPSFEVDQIVKIMIKSFLYKRPLYYWRKLQSEIINF